MNKEYIIRNERKSEYSQVENLTREAFWNVYRPGCLEHYVLHCLREDPAFIPELQEGEDASFFLCKELIPGYLTGISGEYAPPEGYFVDEQECEEFDRSFPPKEKLKLPGQLW